MNTVLDFSGERDYSEGYFQKIETLFSALRGRGVLLSPADYNLALGWYREGIPLSCALRGIREAFYKKMVKDGVGDGVYSLKFCEWAVKAEFKQYLVTNMFEPATPAVPEADPEQCQVVNADIIEGIVFDLDRAAEDAIHRDLPGIRDAIVAARAEVRLAGNIADGAALEARLNQIDDTLMDAVMHAAPGAVIAAHRQQIERRVASLAAGMPELERRNTMRTAVRARLHTEFHIPRLTLYRL